MSAAHDLDSTPTPAPKLYLAFDLGWTSWNLAFTTAMARKPRLKTIPARDLDALQREIRLAKARFGLPDDTPVLSCYEAGRDGFWLHRYLAHNHIQNLVVDAASIEVNRRARRAKSDALDVAKLLTMLIRHHGGETKLRGVVNVPSPDDEDRRQPHRELMALKGERTEHSNRIKGLLANIGLDISVDEHLAKHLEELRQWDGKPVPTELRDRILREFERWELVDRQVHDRENAQRRAIRRDDNPEVEKIRRLLDLKAIGPVSATLFVREFFGRREIGNRREPASLAARARRRTAAANRAGSRGSARRAIVVCVGWRWRSPGCGCVISRTRRLSVRYGRRFGQGNSRARKVGIVALARKLLIALWKYLDHGGVPEGAEFTPWEKKLNGRLAAGQVA